MAIYRGVGGSGESTTNTIVNLVAQYTFDAEAAKIAAQASQTAAEAAKVIAEDASASALADSLIAGNAADEASESAAEAAASAAAADTFDPDNFYTKTASDSLLAAKANQATTYTKTETDSLLDDKADQSTTYTKTEVDASLATKQAVDAELTTLSGMAANRATFLASEQAFSIRNRIINGDMRIDQRNAGASVTVNTAGAFHATDRFRLSGNAFSGVFTGQQVTDAPAGFNNSLRVTVTTADASLAAGDFYYAVQPIEGFNIADLGFGSASAQAVTISFWTKSSLTGTFGGGLVNQAVNRSYPFAYTINAANTWEYKTITIPGDTTGTWLTTNDIGMRVYFGLGVGSDFTGTANQWNAAFDVSVSGAVNVMGTLSATWQVTGVQLEAGSVATTFERRPFGTELALCERYYEVCAGGAILPTGVNGGFLGGATNFRQTKRAAPTVSRINDVNVENVGNPFAEAVTTSGFRAAAQMTTSTGSKFQTTYAAASEL